MKGRLGWALICALVVALSGCVSMRSGHTETTGVAVEEVSTSIASVVRTEVYLQEGRLVVAGELRRMHEVKLPGHVDIAICGPQGLLERKTVQVPGLSSKRKGVMNLPFSTRFSLVPPPGSKVTVRYHAPPFPAAKASDCA